jgi:hypothetical protein
MPLGTAPTKPVRWSGIAEQTLTSTQDALQIDMLTPLTNTPVKERLTEARAKTQGTYSLLKRDFNQANRDMCLSAKSQFETPEVQSLRETRIESCLRIL